VINFTKNTFIQGDNGTGKTTVIDAYNFLLHGKNSNNSTAFEVKPLDSENNHLHNLEYAVSGVFEVDGKSLELERVMTEKWTKKRGSDTAVFDGHSTEFKINTIAVSAGEYKKYIDTELFNGVDARLISDPMYFNSVLEWSERRKFLTSISGEISMREILEENEHLDWVKAFVDQNIDLESKKIDVKSKIATQKTALKDIPSRIDEVDRMTPEPIDFEAVQSEMRELVTKKSNIESSINDLQVKANELFTKKSGLVAELNQSKIELQKAQSDSKIEANKTRNSAIEQKANLEQKVKLANDGIVNIQTSITGEEVQINGLKQANLDLKTAYENLKNSEFEFKGKTNCASCGQSLPSDSLSKSKEDQESKFNQEKAEKLNDLIGKATANNGKIQNCQAIISKLQIDVKNATTIKNDLEAQLLAVVVPDEVAVIESDEEKRLLSVIEKLEFQINQFDTHNKIESSDQLKVQVQQFNNEMEILKSKLQIKTQIEDCDARKVELTNEKKALSQEIANLEKIEMQIDEFNKIFINTVESRVNKHFDLVKFKMFEAQINGGEKPTCVPLINGVPYSDTNTGNQINMGLDIIRTFQREFGISAPVFVDNRERVSVIIDIDCQVVNLEKVKGKAVLEVIK
jgi:DNA repair exonuclease SbcCD ATPase subunit